MVFAKRLRDGIKRGRIKSSVRIWQKPHVKAGGTYAMDDGHIIVDSIDTITRKQITHDLAREGGFESVDDLLALAKHGPGDRIYWSASTTCRRARGTRRPSSHGDGNGIHSSKRHDHRPAGDVWDAMRDVGALHTRLVVGFVIDCKLEGSTREVTFANGMKAKETIIDVDDRRHRVAWTATGGPRRITTRRRRCSRSPTGRVKSAGSPICCPMPWRPRSTE